MPPVSGSGSNHQSRSSLAVRRARERFLTGGANPLPTTVRDEIQASWLRSQHLRVNVDRVEPEFIERLNHDTLLERSANPVMESLRSELAGEPISILVTDTAGTVLQRHCQDPELARRLDAAQLAPGFVYAESSVGTNGIGTAIEMRTPTMVTADEHYAEGLHQFACAAATIHHPITGAFLGVVDFTATARHANPLLLTFAKSTSRRVQDHMLSQTSAREVALMRDYLAACHHTGGSVLALSDDLVMMNAQTQQSYDADDQTALLAKLADVAGQRDAMTLLADLPSGITARLEYRPSFAGGTFAGGVFRVQSHTSKQRRVHPIAPPSTTLPGVVGGSSTWQRVCRAVLDSHRRGEWLVLEGERGAGKLSLLQGTHQALDAGGHFRVLDCAVAEETEGWPDLLAEELASDGGILVLSHVDRLGPELVAQLSAQLSEHSAVDAGTGPWVALTMADDPRNPDVDAQLLPHFPHTVAVPPLRHHLNDLSRLVPHLLGRIARGQELDLAPAALNQLRKLPWPGNVEQLRQVLVRTARVRRSGVIALDDLPPECRAIARRQLSPMESLERDAVIAALVSHGGSKEQAAEALGLSRATIYRKIRDYGIIGG